MSDQSSFIKEDYRSSGLPLFRTSYVRRLFKNLDMTAIYVIGGNDSNVVKIGYAKDPFERFHALQCGNCKKIYIKHILWTQQTLMAPRFEKEVHNIMKKGGRHLRGEWFDVPMEYVVSAFDICSRNVRMTAFSHDEVIKIVLDIKEKIVEIEMSRLESV